MKTVEMTKTKTKKGEYEIQTFQSKKQTIA